MGRKAKFTQEQVFSAADTMAAEGREISPAELIKRLGGGSFTTLYRHLEVWRSGQGEQAPPVIVAMPPVVRQALDQVWQAATSEAFREVTRVREELTRDVVQARRQFEDALATIEALEHEQEQDASREEVLDSEVRHLNETIASLQATQIGLETRLMERESRLVECTSELRESHVTVESQRVALDAATGRENNLREENARLEGRCEQQSLEIERNLMLLTEREERERLSVAELARLRAELAVAQKTRTAPAKPRQTIPQHHENEGGKKAP